MSTVTPRMREPTQAGLPMKPARESFLKLWEYGAVILSAGVFMTMLYFLVTDFSVRRILWPTSGEGTLAKPIGKVTFSLNKALRQANGQPEFVALAQGDAVFPLDTIMAGPGAALKITMTDTSIVEIGENSMIRLSFDTQLQLSGLNRETVVEVVSGMVAAQQGATKTAIKVKSEGKTFAVTREKAIRVSKQGAQVAAHEAKKLDIVENARTKAAAVNPVAVSLPKVEPKVNETEARAMFKKLGGTLSDARPPGAPVSIADTFQKIKGRGLPAGMGKVAAGGGGSLNEKLAKDKTDKELALSYKSAAEMMKRSSSTLSSAKTEVAKALKIEPADNLSLKSRDGGKAASFALPVQFKWQAEPEDALYFVKLSHEADPKGKEQSIQVQAKDGEAQGKFILRKPGHYKWRIVDRGGATLAIRSVHVNVNYRQIELQDPILIGREKGSVMWSAQDKWGFLFKWSPVAGVTKYKVKIARNLSTDSGAVAESEVFKPEFLLPFNKEWQAERMYFSVEGIHSGGYSLTSNHVPFIFTFLPPKPRSPIHKAKYDRQKLTEGAVNLQWEANSDANKFTLEISRDPHFKKKEESEQLSEAEYRYYPQGTGTFYWHVRGDKDTVSSPFSETFEFYLK